MTIEVRVKPNSDSFTLRLGVPSEHPARILVEERIASGSLHFALQQIAPNRWVVWTGSSGSEEEVISYRALIHSRPLRANRLNPRSLRAPDFPEDRSFEPLAHRSKPLSPAERIRAVSSPLSGERGKAFSDQDAAVWIQGLSSWS